VPLAEARIERPPSLTGSPTVRKRASLGIDKRRFARLPGGGRQLELLINGSPSSFALQNISAGGVMGNSVAELSRGTEVFVRFEDGNIMCASVKWTDGGLIGLAFSPPPLCGATS
jgi:hypothetical protein